MTLEKYRNLDLAKLSDDEVLFFIRIRGKASYFASYYPDTLLRQFTSLQHFRTISEYKRDADVHIDLSKFGVTGVTATEQEIINSSVDVSEVVARCRGLRAIVRADAEALVIKCSRYFIDLFSGSKLKLIVMGAIDNYVLDLLERIASYHGIATLGVTSSVLSPEYILVTTRGEHNKVRDPTQEEVERVLSYLKTTDRSKLAPSLWPAVGRAVYSMFSFYYRLTVRYLVRYRLLGNEGYEYRFAPWMRGLWSPLQVADLRFLSDATALRGIGASRVVYLPLHCFPEATIDYWVRDIEDVDYLESVVRVAKHYSELGYRVVVKEHPASFMVRPFGFYRALAAIPQLTILNPFVPTSEILRQSESVVVWTGSTGIEALLRGADVKIVTENYYSAGLLKDYTQDGHRPLSAGEEQDLVRRVLETSIPTGVSAPAG